MNEREQRGLYIAAQYKLTQKADEFPLKLVRANTRFAQSPNIVAARTMKSAT